MLIVLHSRSLVERQQSSKLLYIGSNPIGNSMLKFQLTADKSKEEALALIERAKQGEVPEVSNWEVISLILKYVTDVEFFRKDREKIVTYNLEEMTICVEHNIDPRPVN